jgi:transposase
MPCPKCEKGKIYRQKQPKVVVRMMGSAPIQAKVWSLEWFRCNLCGATFTAPLPAAAGPPEKCDESVTSTLGMLRYGYGMPLNRLAQLQSLVRIPLPASTQWDLINASVGTIAPVFAELVRKAAMGEVLYNDDTTARILELMGRRKAAQEDTDEKKAGRSGICKTGLISTRADLRIALFLTGQKPAGENLADVLEMCDPGRPPMIQMSDGLSHNEATVLPPGLAVTLADCLAHGRRKHVEIADKFPEQCVHVLLELEKVYKNDAVARKERMSPDERLAYHQKHSRSVMDDLHRWLTKQLEDKLVEPNSAFGEATQYTCSRDGRASRDFCRSLAPPSTTTSQSVRSSDPFAIARTRCSTRLYTVLGLAICT